MQSNDYIFLFPLFVLIVKKWYVHTCNTREKKIKTIKKNKKTKNNVSIAISEFFFSKSNLTMCWKEQKK